MPHIRELRRQSERQQDLRPQQRRELVRPDEARSESSHTDREAAEPSQRESWEQLQADPRPRQADQRQHSAAAGRKRLAPAERERSRPLLREQPVSARSAGHWRMTEPSSDTAEPRERESGTSACSLRGLADQHSPSAGPAPAEGSQAPYLVDGPTSEPAQEAGPEAASPQPSSVRTSSSCTHRRPEPARRQELPRTISGRCCIRARTGRLREPGRHRLQR